MSTNTMELLPPSAEKYTSAADVLTDEHLLDKILQCLECRSCLVSAALTSKRWLCAASRFSITNFCACHQPRILGVYISSEGISGSEFIPLLQSDVLNHGDFSFGDMSVPNVWDCRNGSVLFELGGETSHLAGLAVCSPLLFPNKDKAKVLPPSPHLPAFSDFPHVYLLPTDHGDDASCYSINVRTWELGNRIMAVVWVLKLGSWGRYCIATGCLAKSPGQILSTNIVLTDGKIYMGTQAGYILGLNLSEASFFIVDLPDGVELDQYPGNLVHCRGDDSVIYLFHVDGENRLNIWVCRTDNDYGHGGASTGGGANGWVLKDTISVAETCGHLVEQGWETAGDPEDGDTNVDMVVGAGDNAEFVFLELGITGVVVYMDVKTREVKQVYQREPDDDFLISVRPFMFVGPPVFSILDAHEGEAGNT